MGIHIKKGSQMARLRTGDRALLIVIAAALVCAAGWFASRALMPGPDEPVVVCQTKDGFRRVDALDADVTYTVVTGEGDAEGRNTVRIQDGQVDVTEADCSNQVCVDHDPIAHVGEQIVCLPHGMVVEIVAHEEDAASLM